jgi:hypothetical protein
MARSYRPGNITPMLPELAETIASGLMADLKATRLPKIGIEEVRAAIAAREQTKTLGRFELEQLETLTLRKLIYKVG